MPNDARTVFEQISSNYYALTSSEKKVADFTLSNQSGTQFMSISELADACGVAEATISRFCRRLGYKGYNAFKLALANSSAKHKLLDNPLSGEVTAEDSLEDICKKLYTAEVEAMAQTMEFLDLDSVAQASRMLHSARRVMCMGQGGSLLIANEAAHLFSTVSNKFTAVADSHLQAIAATTMDPEDVILFFSYSGSTQEMMETLKLARAQQGQVILVTRFPRSPGAELSNVVLQCGANENALQSGSVAARIAQMYLLDILFSEFSRKDLEQCLQIRGRIADALANRHV